MDVERIQHWLGQGAKPSDRVARFLDAAGLMKREARNNPDKAKPGTKALERIEEKKEKETAAVEAAAQAAEEAKVAAEAPAEEAVAEEETPVEEAPVVEAPAAEEAPVVEEKKEGDK